MSNTDIADAGVGARKSGWRRRRAWVRFLLWLSIPPGAIALAFQLQPAHVVLDIPVTPNAPGYFWWEEQTSQLSYADSWGVLYVRRTVGTAYPTMQGWNTAEEAFAHFHGWLTANGWIYGGIGVENSAVPESRLLKPEQAPELLSPHQSQHLRDGDGVVDRCERLPCGRDDPAPVLGANTAARPRLKFAI